MNDRYYQKKHLKIFDTIVIDLESSIGHVRLKYERCSSTDSFVSQKLTLCGQVYKCFHCDLEV